jgi:hypothetical protein
MPTISTVSYRNSTGTDSEKENVRAANSLGRFAGDVFRRDVLRPHSQRSINATFGNFAIFYFTYLSFSRGMSKST